jgi:hypothetical protein
MTDCCQKKQKKYKVVGDEKTIIANYHGYPKPLT